jgi:uncharacterized membrane protein
MKKSQKYYLNHKKSVTKSPHALTIPFIRQELAVSSIIVRNLLILACQVVLCRNIERNPWGMLETLRIYLILTYMSTIYTNFYMCKYVTIHYTIHVTLIYFTICKINPD